MSKIILSTPLMCGCWWYFKNGTWCPTEMGPIYIASKNDDSLRDIAIGFRLCVR